MCLLTHSTLLRRLCAVRCTMFISQCIRYVVVRGSVRQVTQGFVTGNSTNSQQHQQQQSDMYNLNSSSGNNLSDWRNTTSLSAAAGTHGQTLDTPYTKMHVASHLCITAIAV
jgi:hypothetical protein